MKKLMILSLCLASMLIVAAQTPLEIINKHIEAIGGTKKIHDMKSIKMVYESDNAITGNGTLITVLDVGQRMEVESFMGKVTTIINKKKGWNVYKMFDEDKEEVEVMSETDRSISFPSTYLDIEELLQTEELISYARYGGESKYKHAVLEGKEMVEGKECYKIKLTTTRETSTWYINTKTYYCLKKVEKNKDGKDVETVFSDFRKNQDGCTFPFEEKTYQDGKLLMTETYKEIETNFKADKSLFTYSK